MPILPGRCRQLSMVLGFLAIFFVLLPVASAQEAKNGNEACLSCHGNPQFSVEKSGQQVSLYVDAETLAASVHAKNDCTTCHQGYAQVPHQKVAAGQAPAQEVSQSCNLCHASVVQEFEKSVHAESGAVTCTSCHGQGHNIQPHNSIASPAFRANQDETCGQCHEGRVVESYRESFHGKAVNLGSTRAASCSSCHGAHAILGPQDPASPVAKANIPATCAQCHDQPQANFAAGVEHFELAREGPGRPMFWTYKFFTWLTIAVMVLLIIHMELELWRRLRDLNHAGKAR